jgi:hypothetical protein
MEKWTYLSIPAAKRLPKLPFLVLKRLSDIKYNEYFRSAINVYSHEPAVTRHVGMLGRIKRKP